MDRQLTWGEIKKIMESNRVEDSDIVDAIGLYAGLKTHPYKAVVYREKLSDGKWYTGLYFKD